MINSPVVRNLATQFAQRVRPDDKAKLDDVINQSYQIALSRPATAEETKTMTAFIQAQISARGGNAAAEQLAVRDFCHLLLCANEFIYVD